MLTLIGRAISAIVIQLDLQNLGNLYIAEDPIEILHNDLKLENEAIPDLRQAILLCDQLKDYVSRDLLQKILESEEEHVDHIETQLTLLEQVGKENFLQSQA